MYPIRYRFRSMFRSRNDVVRIWVSLLRRLCNVTLIRGNDRGNLAAALVTGVGNYTDV